MATIIQRENWGRKYFTVLRINGKIISRRRWNQKFTLDDGAKQFKRTGTLYKETKRIRLVNVAEISTTNIRSRPSDKEYQYVVSANVNGVSISARSFQHEPSFPVSQAREEAFESFYERVAQAQGLDYDAAIGRELVDSIKHVRIRERVVYYVKV